MTSPDPRSYTDSAKVATTLAYPRPVALPPPKLGRQLQGTLGDSPLLFPRPILQGPVPAPGPFLHARPFVRAARPPLVDYSGTSLQFLTPGEVVRPPSASSNRYLRPPGRNCRPLHCAPTGSLSGPIFPSPKVLCKTKAAEDRTPAVFQNASLKARPPPHRHSDTRPAPLLQSRLSRARSFTLKRSGSKSVTFAPTPGKPLMSDFDVHGGLAALRSQILSSDPDNKGPYLAAGEHFPRPQGTAPQLPRIQTNIGPSFNGFSATSSNRAISSPNEPIVSSNQRESAESSGGSYSGHSGPSTALTTPSASLDTTTGQFWSGQAHQRVSAASSSRGSNSAFAYSDQLSSPGMVMTASFNEGEDISFSSARESHGGSHNEEDVRTVDGKASEGQDKSKKANPLQDLIETETAYVAELSKVIKKVAAAWSRHNLPPPELDTMFRNIESIYRVNRTFLKSLKEIGPNPSSPRALGDLLMRWIDDLEDPYVRYCENYFTGFDTWPGVQTNTRLRELLEESSAATTPDGTPVTSSDKKRQPGDLWTLDSLFALPQLRLKYYKKLYARLLKSTHAGRSDHRLLVGANEKLDELLEKSKSRISVGVLDDSPSGARERNSDPAAERQAPPTSSRHPQPPTGPSEQRIETDRLAALDIKSPPLRVAEALSQPVTPGSDVPLSPIVPGAQAVPPPLLPPAASPQPLSPIGGPWNSTSSVPAESLPPADELERTLDMSKVLDLFTMQPKKCQLRINPPTLPFRRGLRKDADVVIDFVPLSTGQESIWRRGHIFLLTDLFLICDRMTPSERSQRNLGPEGMWLLFPPLAGKHLKVAEASGPGNALNITILKKETIKVHVQSRQERDEWIAAFEECNKFATNMGLKLKTSDKNPPSAIGSSPMSPSIAVTPSPSDPSSLARPPPGEQSARPSPHASLASTLDRVGSFNSVASFPRAGPGGQPLNGGGLPEGGRGPSPDLRLQAPIGALNGSPRANSPSPGLDAPRGPPGFGARPGGFPRPPPPNGPASPQTGPMAFSGPFARPPMMNGPPRPGMAARPPPGPHPMANGRPPFRPPGPPNQQPYNAGPPMRPRPPPGPNGMPGRPVRPTTQEERDNMRRPSAPNLRERSQGAITPPVRTRSASSLGSQGAPKLPSEMMKDGSLQNDTAYSPPSSPRLGASGPTRSTVAAQMRCRLYLKQSHAQWKSLGNARLKLYHIMPANQKQLVVENDKKMLISTIVLTDAVERVGKVGVAVEVSDNGIHTGIIYMLQMRSEESAQGLFGELIDGGSRTVAIT